MLSSVTEMSKKTNQVVNDWYPSEIVNIISNMPTVYSFLEAEDDNIVKEHLESVIQSRDAMHKAFLLTGSF